MKPNLNTGFLITLLAVVSPATLATLPEPDNVLHGIVVLGTNQVTAEQDNVVIEVQRPDGETIASYQMGQNPAFEDHYLVEIPLESVGDPVNANASVFGADLLVVVKEYPSLLETNFIVHYQSNYVVNMRGDVREMNFGALPSAISSGYDAWEMAYGLPAGSHLLDSDGDGKSNDDEYVAGSDPLDPNDHLTLNIQLPGPGADVEIQWYTRKAEGLGYEGKTRFYALEEVSHLDAVPWVEVDGFTRVLGDDVEVSYTRSETNGPNLYRVRVWLEP